MQLLITRDEEVARQIARELDEENKKRKAFDEQTLREALAKVESEVDLESDRIIVLDSDRWHPGVIGIVASRLVETYHLPTILVSVEGDEGKGSARSIPAFHLTEALRQCHKHLLKYGGHKYAAGLSIRREDIPAFREQVKHVARTVLLPDDLVRKLVVDAEIDLHTIDDEFLAHVERFAPFGPHNTRPVFVSRALRCAGSAQCVGPNQNHLRLRVAQDRTVLDSIGFGFGDVAVALNRPNVRFDLAYVPEYNVWQGQRRIQLRIRDLHVYEAGEYYHA